MHKKRESRKAFTLAEILITLAIIGVVAALTIPNLSKDTNDKELKTAAREFYALFTSAQKQILEVDRAVYRYPLNTTTVNYSLYLFSNQLKFQKLCYNYGAASVGIGLTPGAGTPADMGCWYPASEAKVPTSPWITGTVLTNYSASGILSNGMLIAFRDSYIFVDTNGFKPPNACAEDVFVYRYTDGKYIPLHYVNTGCSVDVIENYLYD